MSFLTRTTVLPHAPALAAPAGAPASTPDERTSPAVKQALIALLAVFGLVWFNWTIPVLRFTSPAANLAFFALALLLPTVAAVLAWRVRPRHARLVAMCTLVPVAVGTLLLDVVVALMLVTTIQQREEPGFALVRELVVDGRDLHVYRTSGGATRGYGVIVRQELPMLPGVRLVREVYRRYPAEDATIEATTADHVRFDGGAPVELHRFVWF